MTQQGTPDLADVITTYQQIHSIWKGASEFSHEQQEKLRSHLGELHDTLWALLQEPLREVAWRWRGSGTMRDILAHHEDGVRDPLNSLAMNLYLHVVEALPRVKIDANKNLVAYLKKIAWNRMYDEERVIYGGREYSLNRSAETGGDFEPVDLDNSNIEERLIEALYRRESRQAVFDFWKTTLSGEDYTIMQARYLYDADASPAPFRNIALQLGPGWTSDAVRQRCHRIIKRTREHLDGLGFGAE